MTTEPTKHKFPEVYRVIFRCAAWKTASERYYTEFHSSAAFADIYHSFHKGKIHAKKITILDVEEYDRYSNLWVSRLDKALEHIPEDIDIKTLHIKDNKVILKRG